MTVVLFFHVEDNGILVEYAYSFLRLILTLPNLGFITAHLSLITAKMCSVTPLFLRLILTLPNLDVITAHFSLISAKMCGVTPLF